MSAQATEEIASLTAEVASLKGRLATMTASAIFSARIVAHYNRSPGGPQTNFDDDRLRNLWRAAGGSFYGPNVEHGDMEESKLLPYLRSLYFRLQNKEHMNAVLVQQVQESLKGSFRHPLFHQALSEALRAKSLFPKSDHLLLAFAEEAGEVVKAGLDIHNGKGTLDDFHKELVQTVAMALRLWDEGDPTLRTGLTAAAEGVAP